MTIKRVYLKDMQPGEVMTHLKNGGVVKHFANRAEYKWVDGVIVRFFDGAKSDLNAVLDMYSDSLYIDIEEPFKIDGPGMYKTRDGTKAFVSVVCKERGLTYPVYGIVQGNSVRSSWTIGGREILDQETSDDIVEKVKGH